MRILVLAEGPVPHPFMNYRAEALVSYLSEKGYDVTVICAKPPPYNTPYHHIKNVSFHYVHEFRPLRSSIDLLNRADVLVSLFSKSWRLHRSRAFDILRAVSFPTGLVATFIEQTHKIPIVCNSSDFYSDLYRQFDLPLAKLVVGSIKRAEERVVKRSTAFICDSPTQRRYWKTWGMDPRKCVVIPHGIPSRNSIPTSEVNHFDLKNKYKIADDEKLVFYIGDISRLDGIDVLISAVNILKSQKIRARFMVVGEGNATYTSSLKNKVQSLGLSQSFIFIRRIPHAEVPKYIANADICVAPFRLTITSNSSIPNKILEYLSMCRPIVATAANGIMEMLGDCIRYVKPEDPLDLAEALAELLMDDTLRAVLSKRERKLLYKLSWRNIVEAEERVMKAALEGDVNDWADFDYIPKRDGA